MESFCADKNLSDAYSDIPPHGRLIDGLVVQRKQLPSCVRVGRKNADLYGWTKYWPRTLGNKRPYFHCLC